MKSSTKWIIAIVTALGVAVLGVIAVLAMILPATRTVSTASTTVTETPAPEAAALATGTWFGFVAVNDGVVPTLVMVDPAEMLTGRAAHDAAVAAGLISEDEDLPNDFFIANPDPRVFTNRLADDAVISVISGDDPGREIRVSSEELTALYNGSYSGEPVYGIVPDQPIVMNITVTDGEVTSARAVYLP
jgi:hypothetical protein